MRSFHQPCVWCALIGLSVISSSARGQARNFGAVLEGNRDDVVGLATLMLKSSTARFDLVFEATGLSLDQIGGAVLWHDDQQVVFDLLGGTSSGAEFEQGGEVVRLTFKDEAVPSANFSGLLDDGLAIILVSTDASIGGIRGVLREDGLAVDPDCTGVDDDDTETNRVPRVKIESEANTYITGEEVVLDASGSCDPDGDTLTFQWVQVTGPDVTLSGVLSDTVTFVAPEVGSFGVTLKFAVGVKDGRGGAKAGNISISVLPPLPDEQEPNLEEEQEENNEPVQDDEDTNTAGAVEVGEDEMAPPCGVCGPLGVVAYFGLFIGWLGLKFVPRR